MPHFLLSSVWVERFGEFVTLLLVVDPFGVIPSFVALTATYKPEMQHRIALKSVIVAFGVLVFFIFAGGFLLAHMGVPLRAFQIAGGIVLFIVALEMVRGEDTAPDKKTKDHLSIAIYPLAIPKIAGPGAMLAVILLTDDDRGDIWGQLGTVGMLVLVMVIQLVLLLAAAPLFRILGQSVASVIGRVMGILLAALAVSLVLSALADWLNLPKL